MWDSIGKVRENKDDMDLLPAHRQNDSPSAKKSISNATLINVDFSSSTKGLFSGMKNFLINLHLLSYFYSAYIFMIIQSKFFRNLTVFTCYNWIYCIFRNFT